MSATAEQKISTRYQTTYRWALSAEYQELRQIMKGCQSVIKIGDFITGISQTDRDAVTRAFEIRHATDRNKKPPVYTPYSRLYMRKLKIKRWFDRILKKA